MPVPKPITLQEFGHVMQTTILRNIPQVFPRIAVANSGGPDSTCLLYLLKTYFAPPDAHSASSQSCPEIISLSVNHNLQECASEMSARATKSAQALGIDHYGATIPWGGRLALQERATSPSVQEAEGDIHAQTNSGIPLQVKPRLFPPKPTDRIEAVAREARYGVLFEWMKHLGANTLFTGHHADDQVETMMMRMSLGSSVLGMAGMRPVRRWGMGTGKEGDCVHYGMEGMGMWHVRPLLEFSKDRILATCDNNNLEYMNDPTNFQPEYGLRNTVRHALKSGTAVGLEPHDRSFKCYQPEHAESLALINQIGQTHEPPFGLGTPGSELRDIVGYMSKVANWYEEKVREFALELDGIKVPGTFAIPLSALRLLQNDTARRVFLYAVVRYVSPRPWGHRAAELGRKKYKVDALVDALWGGASTRCVTPGSDVCWTLSRWDPRRSRWVPVLGKGRPDDAVWLVTRMRPRFKNGEPEDLSIDITSKVNTALSLPHSEPIQALFDNRFLCTLDVSGFDQEIKDLLAQGYRMYIRPGARSSDSIPPRITLETETQVIDIHNRVVDEFGHSNGLGPERPSIKLEFIRPFFE